MIRIAVLVVSIVFSVSSYALNYKSFTELQAKPGKANAAIVNSHLDAIATSFITYERMISQAHGKRLLCMPNNIRLTPGSIEMAIERIRVQYKLRDLSDYPVSELAFLGLVSKYPCSSGRH